MADGGWREPRLSALRTAALAVILFLLVWVVVVEPGPNDLSAIGTLGGFMVVILGYGTVLFRRGGR